MCGFSGGELRVIGREPGGVHPAGVPAKMRVATAACVRLLMDTLMYIRADSGKEKRLAFPQVLSPEAVEGSQPPSKCGTDKRRHLLSRAS
jgi:hypothetical protein